MIEYFTSTFNPDCFFAAIDNVVVAMWCDNHWVDRCIYRPVRSHYLKTEWTGLPYDPATLVNQEEFEAVKSTGIEVPLDDVRSELERLRIKSEVS